MSFENDSIQFETLTRDISNVGTADLINNFLRVVFVPSTPILHDQLGVLRDNMIKGEERLVLQFSSNMYNKLYPIGSFTATCKVVSTTTASGTTVLAASATRAAREAAAAASEYRLQNKLSGQVKIDPMLGVPLADGAYLLSQYNRDIFADGSAICFVKMYFSRGVPVGTSVIVDLVNNQLTVASHDSQGRQHRERLYGFGPNTDINFMLDLASDTSVKLADKLVTQIDRYFQVLS